MNFSAKKVSNFRYFLYFCTAVDIDGVLKTYKIMKTVVKNKEKFIFPNPVDHFCDNIKNMVHFTLENLENNPENLAAFQNGQTTLDCCLEDIEKLRSYLSIVREIISDEMPLPF